MLRWKLSLLVVVAASCLGAPCGNPVSIVGDYELEPDAVDPTAIDVNLLGSPGVSFTSFQNEFTSGLCDFPLFGDLIQLIIGDIEPTVVNGMRDFLADPDGGGPADAPIAEGIETALADISIAGPIGQSLGAILAPIITGDAGPSGELAELKMAHLQLSIIEDATNDVVLGGAVDTRLGMELSFDEVGADAIVLETFVLPNVIAFLLPSLASSLGEFPLPTFLNLELQGVEVSAQGEFMSFFADLLPPAP
jgi:hypothetical protein